MLEDSDSEIDEDFALDEVADLSDNDAEELGKAALPSKQRRHLSKGKRTQIQTQKQKSTSKSSPKRPPPKLTSSSIPKSSSSSSPKELTSTKKVSFTLPQKGTKEARAPLPPPTPRPKSKLKERVETSRFTSDVKAKKNRT